MPGSNEGEIKAIFVLSFLNYYSTFLASHSCTFRSLLGNLAPACIIGAFKPGKPQHYIIDLTNRHITTVASQPSIKQKRNWPGPMPYRSLPGAGSTGGVVSSICSTGKGSIYAWCNGMAANYSALY